MTKVTVLLSTYNGEKYLKEQLDSIFAQTDVEVSVLARDDGSNDGTKKLLSGYEKVKLIRGSNMGVGNSFMNLVYAAEDDSEYYAFADQDDFWEPEKLSEAINLLKEQEKQLYVSNQTPVDKHLREITPLRFDNAPDLSPLSIMSENPVAGCTMVFSREFRDTLADVVHRPTAGLLKKRIHDVWVDMVGAVTGEVIYDHRSFIKYRQHENNVVGTKKSSPLDILRNQIKKFKNPELRNGRSALAREIVEKFPEEAAKEPLLKTCAYAGKFSNKIKLLKNAGKLRSYTGEGKAGFALKVLLGYF